MRLSAVIARDFTTGLSVEGGQEIFIDEPIKH
jgi:hypothetical protein